MECTHIVFDRLGANANSKSTTQSNHHYRLKPMQKKKQKQKYDGCVLAILIKKNYFLDEKKMMKLRL